MGSLDRDTKEGVFLPPSGVSLIALVEVVSCHRKCRFAETVEV